MRSGNDKPVGELIEQLLDAYRLRDKLNEVKLRHAWERLMGDAIARRTTRLRLHRGELTIEVASAPLRQELFNGRERIRTVLNEDLGGDYITAVHVR